MNNGPGIRTTVFLKGCPLDCFWCHNPESKSSRVQLKPTDKGDLPLLKKALQDNTQDEPLRINTKFELQVNKKDSIKLFSTNSKKLPCTDTIGTWMTPEEIMKIVLLDKRYYNESGGMTLSGGEPFFQPGFVLELLRMAKKYEINTCVDTSGYCKPRVIQESLPLTDLYLFDLKIFESERHARFTGRKNELILDNLRWLDDQGAKVVLRCPIIPSINDSTEHLESIKALYLKLKGIVGVQLMPYENYWMGKYPEFNHNVKASTIPPMAIEKIRTMEEFLIKEGVAVLPA